MAHAHRYFISSISQWHWKLIQYGPIITINNQWSDREFTIWNRFLFLIKESELLEILCWINGLYTLHPRSYQPDCRMIFEMKIIDSIIQVKLFENDRCWLDFLQTVIHSNIDHHHSLIYLSQISLENRETTSRIVSI